MFQLTLEDKVYQLNILITYLYKADALAVNFKIASCLTM